MKKLIISTILAVFLSISAVGFSIASDSKSIAEIKKPSKISGPHPVTMEAWTEIVRSLQKTDNRSVPIPDKPFRFMPKQNNLTEL